MEPIYLQAETSELPEMKRIVVSYNDKVAMAATLDQALNQIFGEQPVKTIEEQFSESLPMEDGQYEKLLEELENIIEQLREMNEY